METIPPVIANREKIDSNETTSWRASKKSRGNPLDESQRGLLGLCTVHEDGETLDGFQAAFTRALHPWNEAEQRALIGDIRLSASRRPGSRGGRS